jgi:hypothetical protein
MARRRVLERTARHGEIGILEVGCGQGRFLANGVTLLRQVRRRVRVAFQHLRQHRGNPVQVVREQRGEPVSLGPSPGVSTDPSRLSWGSLGIA